MAITSLLKQDLLIHKVFSISPFKIMAITPDQAVQDGFDYMKTHSPDDYKKIEANASKVKEITAEALKAAEEELKLSSKLADPVTQPRQVPQEKISLDTHTQLLAHHLPEDRIKMIREGLEVPTFELNIRKEGGKSYADFTSNGEKFQDSIELAEKTNILLAITDQQASIIVETIMLAMQVIGIHADIKGNALKNAIAAVKAAGNKQATTTALNDLGRIIRNKETIKVQATAIWGLMKAIYHDGVIWGVFKVLRDNMSYWDWAKTVIEVVAAMVAAISTEGVAMMIKIAIALRSAVVYTKKFFNLMELESM